MMALVLGDKPPLMTAYEDRDRAGSISTLDSLDFARYSDDGNRETDERVADTSTIVMDFELWDDVGLNIPKPPDLLQLYRDFGNHHVTARDMVDVSVGVEDDDLEAATPVLGGVPVFETAPQSIEVSRIADSEKSVMLMLGRCLPHIVPNVLLAKREINHKYPERRLLVAESCGALAPYLPKEIRSSLVLSMLQQMLMEDKADLVREAVIKSLGIIMGYIDDPDKYQQEEDRKLLVGFLEDVMTMLSLSHAPLDSLKASFVELG
ncbi:hypothetical protein llap_6421 [Limosa lapponica baueri]|uniref:Uncharacterized protein n=1 Tax=Limosa lapponica baueri TaxID=1758121 RepID=A0A2I0UB26_LIMLA|nr:hypothetical protein llap_6421 [Limosa lapponica baueri]